MFKLVVLSAFLAVVAAKPSALLAPLAPVVYAAAPSAVSHQSRVDYHHSYPAVHAYAAPAAYAAYPWNHAPLALDRHTPAVVLGAHGVPLDTVDVVAARAYHNTVRANHHYLHKRSLAAYAAPVAYTTAVVAAPAAVSHQSRVDVHHSAPLVHSYVAAAPVVSHYAAATPYYGHYPYSTKTYWGNAAYGVHPW